MLTRKVPQKRGKHCVLDKLIYSRQTCARKLWLMKTNFILPMESGLRQWKSKKVEDKNMIGKSDHQELLILM